MDLTTIIDKYIIGDMSRTTAVDELMKLGFSYEDANEELDKYSYL